MNPLRGNVVIAAATKPVLPPATAASIGSGRAAPPGMAQSNRAAKRAKARDPCGMPEVTAALATGASSGDAVRPVAAALSVEVLESIQDICPALEPLLKSLSREVQPRTAAERNCARATVDEFVASCKPAAVASEIGSVEAELVCAKRAREVWVTLPEATRVARLASFDEEIAKLQHRLDSLSRKAPTADGLACSLKAAKAEFQQHVQSRRDAWTAGSANAEARSKKRGLALDRMVVQCGTVRAAFQAEEARIRDAHRARSELCDTEFNAALAEFDRRIGDAQPRDADTGPTLAAEPPPADTNAQLAAMQQQITTFQQELAQSRAQLLQAQREAAFGVQVDDPPAVADLPQLDVKDKDLMAACAMVHCLLTHAQGRPFTMDQAVNAGCPSFTATIHQLLGNHAARWNASDGVVPKQVCNLLLQALQALQVRGARSMEVDPATAKRCADWAESLRGKRKCTGSAIGAIGT